jgi:hypothetical protein
MWLSAMGLVVPEGNGGVDEMCLDAVMSNVWPVRSIASRREEGKRPEELQAPVASVEVGRDVWLQEKLGERSGRRGWSSLVDLS